MLRYPVLVLDHDDTVVNSTPQVHYPIFMKNLEILRPDAKLTLDEFIMYCFDPGFREFCVDILQFTEEEEKFQEQNWMLYVRDNIPKIFKGFDSLLNEYEKKGGRIFVVSHSNSGNILRDYKANNLPVPEMVFGWDRPAEERKPNAFPLEEIMRVTHSSPEDILMVDDLKPGYEMAKKCDVAFACAGWSNEITEIRNFMKKYCDYYLTDVSQLYDLLFR